MRRPLFVAAAVPVVAIVFMAIEVVVAVKAPRLPNAAPFDLRRESNDPDAPRVLWLGDSTAAGVGASNADQTLPLQVAKRSGNVDLTVLAVSGATLGDVVRDQAQSIKEIDPDCIYISVGANDVTHFSHTDDVETYYEQIFDLIPEHTKVVVLGVPDMGSPTRFWQPLRAIAGARGRAIDDVVRDVAMAHGAQYVDIEGETGPSFRNHPKELFAADGFHPSDAGYLLWSDAVTDTLRGN